MLPVLRPTSNALAAALLLASTSAFATDDKAIRDAQARFAEGLARVKKGDFEAARISFAQAYVVLHKPDILWNLALAEEKSGHPLEALGHFKELTNVAEADTDRANAQKHVVGLMGQTGHIEVMAPAGTIVTIDGVQAAGSAPFMEPIDVAPGTHVVEGRLPDGLKSVTVKALAGQTATAPIQPTPPAGPAPAPAPESAPAPTPTPTPAPDTSGPDTPAPSTAKIITTSALGGAGLLAIGLGAYFGLQSQSEGNTAAGFRGKHPSDYCANASSPDCGSWNDAVQAQNRDATVSNVLYVTGGVLAAGAVVTWFLWPKARATTSGWVVPVVGPGASGGANVGVWGRF
jgi:hypothetical protein